MTNQLLKFLFYYFVKWHVEVLSSETCVLPKGFEPESFQLKYNPPTFEYKIHTVKVDLYYFKSINQKSSVLNTFCPSIKQRKMDGRK